MSDLQDVLSRFRNPTSQKPQTARVQSGMNKQRVLVWSDSVLATTGFGTVSRYILKALHQTGRYEIDQLAINHFTPFYDKKLYPYNILAARQDDADDPYGNKMFLNIISHQDYDIVFIINDTFVVEQVAGKVNEIRYQKAAEGRRVFNLVYYYPVDCKFLPSASTMVAIADKAVAYTEFAAKSTREVLQDKPDQVIYHGTDVNLFRKLPSQAIADARGWIKVTSPETFMLISVNRNSIRKDIARTLLAFSEFKKKVPNSVLYLHTKMKDGVGGLVVNLHVPLLELGLSPIKDVIFPQNIHPARGFPVEKLVALYNAADAFITTNLGEGWGLTMTEAMACETPVIAPLHTSGPEIFGTASERAYAYPCKERIYVDNSGYRPVGYLDDILAAMHRCHKEWVDRHPVQQVKIRQARRFVEQHSWPNVCAQWVKLFSQLQPKPTGLAQAGWIGV